MTDSILEFVRSQLAEMPRSNWHSVHEATGVPVSSIEKIVYGVHDNPRIRTLEPLYRYLTQKV